MGLYGDYHYRPLQQSSTSACVPLLRLRWFSEDYMWLQDMRPHSLNQFFSFILFLIKIDSWSAARWRCRTPLNIQSWICTYAAYPFVGFRDDAIDIGLITRHDGTWDRPLGAQITFQSHPRPVGRGPDTRGTHGDNKVWTEMFSLDHSVVFASTGLLCELKGFLETWS